MARLEQDGWFEQFRSNPAKALEKFREHIEALRHNDRVKAMVLLGRESAGKGPSSEQALFIIESMRRGGFSERYLALNSCFGSKDAKHIEESLSDKFEMIRALSRQLIVLYGTAEQITRCAELISRFDQQKLIKALSTSRRRDVVDLILERIKSSTGFTRLLPYGSYDFSRRCWNDLADDTSEQEWMRLARNQPDYAVEQLDLLVQSMTEFDPRVVSLANAVMPIFARRRDRRLLNILARLMQHCPLDRLVLTHAVRAFPKELANLLLSKDELANVNFSSVLHRVDSSQLIPLLKRYPAFAAVSNFRLAGLAPHTFNFTGSAHHHFRHLQKLAPSLRAEIYAQFNRAWRVEQGILPLHFLNLMPASIRHEEGRLHLKLDSISTNPAVRLPYASLLPWAETLEVVRDSLRDPDPELRAIAWAALISSLRFNRNNVTDALVQVQSRSKEQDPIRLAIVTAMRGLPPSVWKEEHLPALSAVAKAAINAKDLSWATSSQLESLIVSLIPTYPAWAMKELAELWKQRAGSGTLMPIDNVFNDNIVKKIAPDLVPVLNRWMEKEYQQSLLRVAGIFGRRLEVFDELVNLLEQLVLEAAYEYNCTAAFGLIQQRCRARLEQLVPRMLKKDRSWAIQPVLIQHLHRYRQDLITPYLGQNLITGRFHKGKNRVVPHLHGGMHRLSANQLSIYADAVWSLTTDKENRRFENFFIISRLAQIPDCPIQRIAKFAAAKNENTAERDHALIALGSMDGAQGIDILLDALNDERVSVAIYALRSALLKMTADEAIKVLKRVPTEKLTVHKEVVRLLGDIRSDEAYKMLTQEMQKDLHRDVKVAVVRSLWNHLHKDEVWKVLRDAVSSEDEALAFVAVRTPSDNLSAQGRRQLVSLLNNGAEHHSLRVRMKTMERCTELPIGDPDMLMLKSIIDALMDDSPNLCVAAAQAMMSMYGHRAVTALPRAVESVMPKRRNLKILVDTIFSSLIRSRERMRPAAHASLLTMARDPLTICMQVRLAVGAMDWTELGAWFGDLFQDGKLHADAITTAGAALLSCGRDDLDASLSLETMLANSKNPELRQLALHALNAASNGSGGWTGERLARLKQFRQDDSAWIAEAAQFILPDAELVEMAAKP